LVKICVDITAISEETVLLSYYGNNHTPLEWTTTDLGAGWFYQENTTLGFET
jgi:hypothetical protein